MPSRSRSRCLVEIKMKFGFLDCWLPSVRFDDTHQAFMVVRKGEWRAVIYDGLRHIEAHSKRLLSAAVTALTYIADVYGVDPDGLAAPVEAIVPRQYDGWSCGHKLVASVAHLLDVGISPCLDGSYKSSLPSIAIPTKVASTDALAIWCRRSQGQGAVKAESLKIDKPKTETGVTASASAPSAAPKHEPSPPSTPVRRKLELPGPGRQSELSPPCIKKAKVQEHQSADVPSEKAPKQSENQDDKAKSHQQPQERGEQGLDLDDQPLSSLVGPPPQAVALDKAIEEQLEARRERQRIKRLGEIANRMLKASGISHNYHFQKAHSGGVGAGHWTAFKLAVVGHGNVQCRICQDLMMQHCIRAVEMDKEGEATLHQQQNLEAVIVPVDPDAHPPALHQVSQSRRGRPAKGSQPAFDLKAHLEIERPGLYRFLTQQEVRQELPAKLQEGSGGVLVDVTKPHT